MFTSSLLGMLAEYDVRPPQIYPSTITTVTKVTPIWSITSKLFLLGSIQLYIHTSVFAQISFFVIWMVIIMIWFISIDLFV